MNTVILSHICMSICSVFNDTTGELKYMASRDRLMFYLKRCGKKDRGLN
jgi:hypothetical protein